MKKILLILTTILLMISIAYPVQSIGGGNIPGFNCDHFYDPSPGQWEEDVEIGAKGVQTCINVTIDTNCTVNITFQWFNWSQYFDDLIDYEEGDEFPNYYNDSYWHNYSDWTALNTSQRICAYQENVSCYTEGNYETYWSDWRIIANFTCPGNYTYNETCYYFFTPEACPVHYIHPPSPNGTACPCCDAMCVGVDNDLGHNMNVTVYGRDGDCGCPYWHIWNTYTNITNGTYCYCMDTISPTIQPYIVASNDIVQEAIPIDVWHNVSFKYYNGVGIEIDTTNDLITILSHGYYTITYWIATIDSSTGDAVHRTAARLTSNDIEIEGSYREESSDIHMRERDLSGFVHGEFFNEDELRLQFIADNGCIRIGYCGHWTDNNTSAYIYIEKTDIEESHPLQYNTTYEWYVNVTDTVTNESTESAIFQFKTALDPSYCICSREEECCNGGLDTGISMGIMGGVLGGIVGAMILTKKKKEVKDDKERNTQT